MTAGRAVMRDPFVVNEDKETKLDERHLHNAVVLELLEDEFEAGRYRPIALLWQSALKRAGELSRHYAPVLGTRSLDGLHVASAREPGLRRFVSFDERQQKLARAVGLNVVMPIA